MLSPPTIYCTDSSLQLAIGILTSLFVGIYAATGSGAKKPASSIPPINASSRSEESFIQ